MSVRKRNWVTKGIAKEAWVVDYVDTQGKRRLKTFSKKKEADDFSASSRTEVRDGVHVADRATVTVEEAGKLWLRSGHEDGLERTTLDQRRLHLRLYINPLIGKTRLNKITAPFVRAFQDKLRDAGRSAAIIKRATTSLGSILADAQGRGLIIRNAVHELSRARSGQKKAVEKRGKKKLVVGVDIPTSAEIRAILEAAKGHFRPLIVTAIFTGLRASELRGLRWQDVDLSKGELLVRQRADRYGDIGMPKTGAGQRTVPLPPLVANTLREWRLACPNGALGLVFPNGEGKVEFLTNIMQRGVWPTMVAAGVTKTVGKDVRPKYSGLHALRHWFVSWCINAKKDGGLQLTPKAVQERIGHSSIVVTLDTYGHLFPVEDEQKELEAAQQRLFAVMSQ